MGDLPLFKGRPIQRPKSSGKTKKPSTQARPKASSAPVPASGWRANFDFRSGLSDKAFDALGYQVGLHAPQEDVDLMGCGGPHYEVAIRRQGRGKQWPLGPTSRLATTQGIELLPNQVYEARLLALAVLQASWSPAACIPAPAGGVFGCQACLFSLGTKLGTLALWRCEVTRPAHPTPSDITTITPHGQQPSGAGRAAEAGTAAADGAAAPAIAPASSTARGAAQARHALEESTKQQHAQRFTYLGMLQAHSHSQLHSHESLRVPAFVLFSCWLVLPGSCLQDIAHLTNATADTNTDSISVAGSRAAQSVPDAATAAAAAAAADRVNGGAFDAATTRGGLESNTACQGNQGPAAPGKQRCGQQASRWGVVGAARAEEGELLLLATGASDGSVRLWGGLASSMMYEGPAGFSLLAEVAKADGQAPTCMDVALGVPDAEGRRELLLAIGKPGGAIASWRSGPAANPCDLLQAVAAATTSGSGATRPWRKRRGCHSLAGVTGVRVHPWGCSTKGDGRGSDWMECEDGEAGMEQQQQQQQREVLVSSSGVDGEVKCWRMCADGGLQDATPPQRFNPLASYTAPKKATTLPSSKHPAMGLASSPNGLVVAVARNLCTADDGMAGNSKTMTWRRLIEGSLHLYTLYGQMQSSKQQQPQQEQQQQQQQLHLTAPLGEQGQKEGRGRADGERGEGDGVLPGGVGQAADGGNVQGEAQQGQNAGQQQQQQQQEGQDALLAPGGLLDSLLPALAYSIGSSGGQWADAAVMWELSAAVLMAGWKTVPAPELQAPPASAPADGDAMDEDDEGGEGDDMQLGSDAALQAAAALATARKHITQLRRAQQATQLAATVATHLGTAYLQLRDRHNPQGQASNAIGGNGCTRIGGSGSSSGSHGPSFLAELLLDQSAIQSLAAGIALRRLVLTNLRENLQLAKAMAALAPLLPSPYGRRLLHQQQHHHSHQPNPVSSHSPLLLLGPDAGADGMLNDGTSVAALQQHAAAHQLPEWLFVGQPARDIAAAEAPALQLPAALETLEHELAAHDCVALQAHIWQSLRPALDAPSLGTAATAPVPAQRNCAVAPARCFASASVGRTCGEPAHGSAQGTGQPLWRLLMADWVCMHARHPTVIADELLPLAQQVYAAAGEDPPSPGSSPLPREHSPLGGLLVGLNPPDDPVVCARSARCPISDGPIITTTTTSTATLGQTQPGSGHVGQQHQQQQQQQGQVLGAVEVPRCSASLQLMGSPAAAHNCSSWHCPACKRRYAVAPQLRPSPLSGGAVVDLPHCLFCALRLAAGAPPPSFLVAPSVRMCPMPPEPLMF